MKLYKLAIMLLLFIITNAYADATVKPSNVNNKTHNNINIEQQKIQIEEIKQNNSENIACMEKWSMDLVNLNR